MSEISVEDLLERPAGARMRALVVTLLCCFMIVEGYDMQVLGYAAPAILKDLHVSKEALGVVFGGAMAGFMGGALLLSPLGDVVGRKRVIVGGLCVFGLFTCFNVLAHSVMGLLWSRAVAGIGLGVAVPAAIALMSDLATARSRAKCIAILYLGYTGGSALGGLIAANLIPAYGWRSVFIVGGALPLLIAAVLALLLPESVRFLLERRRGSRQLSAMLTRLAPGIAAAAVTLPYNPAQTDRSAQGPRQLFTDGRTPLSLLLWIGCIGNMMTHHFMTSWLPTVMASSGVTLRHAIIATSLLQVAGALGGFMVCALIDRFGVVGLACALTVGIPCLIGIGHSAGSGLLLMTLVFGVGFCLVGGQTGLNALSGILYPPQIRVAGVGWANGVGRLGAVLGPLAGGFVISSGLSGSSLFLIAALPVAVAVVALFGLCMLPAAREAIADRHRRAVVRTAPLLADVIE